MVQESVEQFCAHSPVPPCQLSVWNGEAGKPSLLTRFGFATLRQPKRRAGWLGNYITSLEMAGCSITMLRADDELLSLWDDPVLTPGLRWGI